MSTEPEAPAPENAAPASGTPEKPAERMDQIDRIRSDPEFAVDQFKKLQATNTRMYQELQRYEPLKNILSSLEGGAQTAAKSLYEYSALLQDPTVHERANYYRQHGTIMPAQANHRDEDEYVDPLEAKLNEKLSAIEARINSMSSNVNHDRSVLAQTTMRNNLQDLRTKYEHLWDLVEPKLLDQVKAWDATPSGRDVMAKATLDTWDAIAKIAIGENLDEVARRHVERTAANKRALATEAVPHKPTNGREEPIVEQETFRPGQAWQIAQEFRRRNGVSA